MDGSKVEPDYGKIYPDVQGILPKPDILLKSSKRYQEGKANNLLRMVEEAIQQASELMKPAAIWAVRPLDEYSLPSMMPDLPEEMLRKLTIHFGVVCTIGNDLDSYSQSLFQEGHFTRGYWLDQVGTYSVSLLSKVVANQLCVEYGAIRWAPGDNPLDPSIQGQQDLFNWVPADQIGVSLTGAQMMFPLKSLSYNLFAGPDAHGIKCLIPCNRCVWNGACDRTSS